MKIINKTPHPVIILDENHMIIKRFESEGSIRLQAETLPSGELEGVPVTKTRFGDPEGLPEQDLDTFYIVSQLVKSALPYRVDLFVPAEVVRDEGGNIIGCRSLGR